MEFNPVQTNQMPIDRKIKNIVWRLVNNTLFRFTPHYLTVFRKWRVLLTRLFGADIDWTASIHPSANIDYPWNLKMGKRASLGAKSWTYAMAPISIGDLSCIGKDVYLLTGSHDISKPTFDLVIKPITIGQGVWIATGAKVLPGVTIGDFSVVAAGAVVCKLVEAYSVIGGNPAKFIKKRELN